MRKTKRTNRRKLNKRRSLKRISNKKHQSRQFGGGQDFCYIFTGISGNEQTEHSVNKYITLADKSIFEKLQFIIQNKLKTHEFKDKTKISKLTDELYYYTPQESAVSGTFVEQKFLISKNLQKLATHIKKEITPDIDIKTCFLLIDDEIHHGMGDQCNAFYEKIHNPRTISFPNAGNIKRGLQPPTIVDVDQKMTNKQIYLYITSTGVPHFISDDWKKLQDNKSELIKILKPSQPPSKPVINKCYLLKLNSDGTNFDDKILSGQPFQCEALAQKISNLDQEDFTNGTHIYEINKDLTKLGVFTYISRTGIAHIISVKKESFYENKFDLLRNLQHHFSKK